MPGLAISLIPKDRFGKAVEIIERHGCRVVGRLSRRIGSGIKGKAEAGDPMAMVLIRLVKSMDENHTGIVYVCPDNIDSEELERELEKLENG